MASPEVDPGEQSNTWCESGTVASVDGGAGDVDPDGGDVAHGWPDSASPPKRQRFNWVFKYLMQAVRFMLHAGVPNYINTRNYAVGDRVQDPSTHLTYQALLANGPLVGVEALSNATYWARWGHSDAQVTSSINSAIGTLSGTATGIAGDSGATVSNKQHFNMPGTTHKLLLFTINIPLSSGGVACIVTFSGADAFANHALNAVVSTLSDAGGVIAVKAEEDGTNTATISVASAPGSSINLCVFVSGD